MLRYSATCLLLIVSVSASGAAACDLAMVDGLEKRGYSREQVTRICEMRPQKAGETAKGGSQDEPVEPSPAKVGGSAAPDKLMERPTPIKIDDPFEFMRGYWKVTWRVTNVPNFPQRLQVWRIQPKRFDTQVATVSWSATTGTAPRIDEAETGFKVRMIIGGIWLSDQPISQPSIGLLRGTRPSVAIDLTHVHSRDAVKGGFLEPYGNGHIIGELEFERIPEDKLVEVLKSLN